jgi:predicted RNase H-like HicB family nuclease
MLPGPSPVSCSSRLHILTSALVSTYPRVEFFGQSAGSLVGWEIIQYAGDLSLDEPIYDKYVLSLRGFDLVVTAQNEFHVVIEKGEDGYYVASVVELPGCHTQARELSELDDRVKEVITLYLEAEGENLTVPEFIALKKVKI